MQDIIKAFQTPKLRNKFLFTFLIITLFMVATIIPMPGVSVAAFRDIATKWGEVGYLLNIVSGKALYNASFISLGIYPFVIGSIISQVVTIAVPSLRSLAEMGEAGTKKITKLTRMITIGISVVLSVILAIGVKEAYDPSLNFWVGLAIVTVCSTVGCSLIAWACELNNTKGIGNGISIILVAAIARNLPHVFKTVFVKADAKLGMVAAILFTLLGVVLAIVALIALLYVNLGERKLRFLFQKRTFGMKQYQGQNQSVPIKVTQAGIMPIIYTMSVLALPAWIVSVFGKNSTSYFVVGTKNFTTSVWYYVFFAIFLISFTYVFSLIQFNPIQIANELKQNGGYIAGVKPGKPTSVYLYNMYNNMNFADCVVITSVCMIPMFVGLVPAIHGFWYAGIALFVVAGAMTETKTLLDNEITKIEEENKSNKKLKTGKMPR